MQKPIVILGAGGHGKVVFDICRTSGRDVRGFLDHGVTGTVHDVPVLGGDERLEDEAFVTAHHFAIGVGDRHIRKRLGELLIEKGATQPALIHPSATIAEGVKIGAGTVVMAGAVINIDSEIGEQVIVNTRSSIDHDCRLGDRVQICPGATLAGEVTCGDDVFVGSGATLLPSVSIGARTYVGAGATVNRDLPEDKTVVGRSFRFAPGGSN